MSTSVSLGIVIYSYIGIWRVFFSLIPLPTNCAHVDPAVSQTHTGTMRGLRAKGAFLTNLQIYFTHFFNNIKYKCISLTFILVMFFDCKKGRHLWFQLDLKTGTFNVAEPAISVQLFRAIARWHLASFLHALCFKELSHRKLYVWFHFCSSTQWHQ